MAVLEFCIWGLTGRVFLFGGGQREIKLRRRKTAFGKGRSPLRLGGLVERRTLPQAGSGGGAPETDAILDISSRNGVHYRILLISHF